MRKARILLILGVWVAVLPYLGFPYSWKQFLFTLSGLGIVYVSYMLYRERKREENPATTFDNFSENNHSSLSEVEQELETAIEETERKHIKEEA